MRAPRLSELLITPPTAKALEWIRLMRGANYQSRYLKSRLWREIIRPQVLRRDNHRCTVCGKFAKGVHHLSYDESTMLGHDLSRLKSVCNAHHDAAHFGNPPLQLGPLVAQFRTVRKAHRAESRLKVEFLTVGGTLAVSSRLGKSWRFVEFTWQFADHLEAVARLPNRFFFLAASRALGLEYAKRNSNSSRGTKLRDRNGVHCATFLFNGFSDGLSGTMRLRVHAFPDWVKTVKALTSEHPYPVLLRVEEAGALVERCGNNCGNRHLA